MRLTDLAPRWIGVLHWAGEFPFHVGVSFLCPHCREQRLAVRFRPPIDPGNYLPQMASPPAFLGDHLWNRSGETFEDLTLSPSIDFSAHGHWHGAITAGEIIQ
jgi:hypothetical protein